MKRLIALLLICFAIPAGATVTVDATANSGAQASQTSITFSITIGGTANYLVVIEHSAGGGHTPSGITAGGSAMTLVGSINNSSTNYESSLWVLATPGSGSKSIVITYGTSSAFQGSGAISLIGVNLAGAHGTLVTASQPTSGNSTPAVTATGGGSSDLYVGGVDAAASTSIAASGTNQTQRFNINSIGTVTSVSGDSIPGTSAGAFSWTETGANPGWTALAMPVFGGTANNGMMLTLP